MKGHVQFCEPVTVFVTGIQCAKLTCFSTQAFALWTLPRFWYKTQCFFSLQECMDRYDVNKVKYFLSKCTQLYCAHGSGVVCNFLKDMAVICQHRHGVVVKHFGCGKSKGIYHLYL